MILKRVMVVENRQILKHGQVDFVEIRTCWCWRTFLLMDINRKVALLSINQGVYKIMLGLLRSKICRRRRRTFSCGFSRVWVTSSIGINFFFQMRAGSWRINSLDKELGQCFDLKHVHFILCDYLSIFLRYLNSNVSFLCYVTLCLLVSTSIVTRYGRSRSLNLLLVIVVLSYSLFVLLLLLVKSLYRCSWTYLIVR